MPSTYTLNNGIELVATGEQSGTWGDTTNTNFELLDTSLDGQVTVTLGATGSSGSPNTLPVSDGAASNGRNRLVIFADSSDLGGTAYVQLTPNDAEKIIYVRNSLSGSRSILLFQGTYNASNDYEVPAGTTAVVFFNGAGSGAVAANVFNNAHFDAMNVVGGVTITVDDNSENLKLITTDADASVGPTLRMDRQSASAADGDLLGKINFVGHNDAGTPEDISYASLTAIINDASDGGEDGKLAINTIVAGTERSRVFIDAGETVFNEDSQNIDFRIESNGDTHCVFVDGESGGVQMGGSADLTGSIGIDADGRLGLVNTGNGHAGVSMYRADHSISANNTLGMISAYNDDTTSNNVTELARIEMAADGAFSAGDNPTRISFHTTENDTESVREVGRFDNGGTFKVNRGAIFNDDSAGATNADFQIESDNNGHMFFVDASADFVGVGTSAPVATLVVSNGGASGIEFQPEIATNFNRITNFNRSSSAYNEIGIDALAIELRPSGVRKCSINASDMVVNQDSADYDFRVEGNNHSHAFFIEGSTDRIGINTSSPSDILHIADSNAVVIKLENTDASLSSDQVIGAIQWRVNDPSGIGVADIAQVAVRSDSSVGGSYYMQFNVSSSSSANFEALRINRTGDVTTTGGDFDRDVAGFTARRGDSVSITRTAGTALEVNRSNDGDIVNFRSAGNIEGTISISGSTTSYNGFAGRHESSGIPLDTEIGTVVSTIDELDIYPEASRKAGQTRADHAKIKVSDSVGDTRVYGVVSEIDDQNKTFVTSVGIGSVKVTGACQGGDLLESNGDGTAKVQSDDIIRSKTIGKVTIGNSNTGVKLVSCVMYCG